MQIITHLTKAPTTASQQALKSLLLTAVVFSFPAKAQSGEIDLLLFDSAIAGHKQYTEEITRNLHILFERKVSYTTQINASEEFETQQTEWWQDGASIRAKHRIITLKKTEISNPIILTIDHCRFKDDVRTFTIAEGGDLKAPQRSTAISEKGTRSIGVDPWSATGNFTSTSPTEIWLYEQLSSPGKLKTCKWVVEGEKRMILIEKIFDESAVRALLAPDLGFCPIKRWIFTRPNFDESNKFSQTEVISFWPTDTSRTSNIPKEMTTKFNKNADQTIAEARTKITFATNTKKIQESTFHFAIPKDSMVVDRNNDRIYKTGHDGQIDTKHKVLKLSKVEVPQVYTEAPQDIKPKHFPFFWFFSAFGTILIGLALFLKYRKKQFVEL